MPELTRKAEIVEILTVTNKSTYLSAQGSTMTNVTLKRLPILPGYYRTSNMSYDLRRCPDLGAQTGCVGGLGLSEGPCKEWLRGPYCQLCNVTDTSRFYSPSDSACLPCEGDVWEMPVLVSSLIIATLIFALLWKRFKPHHNVRCLARMGRRLGRLSAQLSLRAKGKQVRVVPLSCDDSLPA